MLDGASGKANMRLKPLIVGHRGPTIARQYKIRWKGYPCEYDTFEPRTHIHPELIKDHELEKGVYVHSWKFRCDVCDLPCSSARGIAIYKARTHKKEKVQNFCGTLADEAVKVCKIIDQQAQRPVICNPLQWKAAGQRISLEVSWHNFHCRCQTEI